MDRQHVNMVMQDAWTRLASGVRILPASGVSWRLARETKHDAQPQEGHHAERQPLDVPARSGTLVWREDARSE